MPPVLPVKRRFSDISPDQQDKTTHLNGNSKLNGKGQVTFSLEIPIEEPRGSPSLILK